jgi:hypothetical protein
MKIDTTDPANWEKAAQWQCEKARMWLQATSEVFADDGDEQSHPSPND